MTLFLIQELCKPKKNQGVFSKQKREKNLKNKIEKKNKIAP